MSLLVTAATVVTAVVGLALAAAAILRRQSAARRHAVLAAALFAGAAAPVFAPVVPAWDVPVSWGTAAVAPDTTTGWSSVVVEPVEIPSDGPVAFTEPVTPAVSLTGVVLVLWLFGAVVTLAGLATGLVRLARLTARCTPVDSGPWRAAADAIARRSRLSRRIALLQSDDPSLLLTWGLFRPRIVLPAGADSWPAGRREVVLAHEIAHIRRHDWTLLVAAEIVHAVHWFNPIVWVACRRLRRDSEIACDDEVLNGGVAATEYASHLLEVARHAAGRGRAWAAAPAVAESSTLERRIAAMLSHADHREPLTRRVAVLAVAGALAMTVPLVAVSFTPQDVSPLSADRRHGDLVLTAPAAQSPPPVAQAPPVSAAQVPVPAPDASRVPVPAPDATPVPEPARAATSVPSPPPTPGEVSGVVRDSSGGVLPGVRITLTEMDPGTDRETITDAAGRFRFRGVQPGRYSLVASLPGFTTVRREMTVAAAERAPREMEITLRLGALSEQLVVVCPATAAASALALQPVTLLAWNEYARPHGIGVAEDRTPARPAVVSPLARQDAAVRAPVRVGGAVRAPQRIRMASPHCPGVGIPDEGVVVILEAVLSEDGLLTNVRSLRDAGEAFVEAALAAVRQWTYSPARLNGRPVAVIATITISYSRAG